MSVEYLADDIQSCNPQSSSCTCQSTSSLSGHSVRPLPLLHPPLLSCIANQPPVPDSHTTTSFSILPTPPPRLTPATESEKVEAVRVLAAGNALVALLVLGVMGMQVGQEYARRLEEREQGEIDRRFAAQVAAGAGAEGKVESKKTK